MTENIKIVRKGELILSEGQICREEYLVLKGCLKSYVIDEKGKEHVLEFAPENWYISDLDGLINNKPSRIFIEAMEDSELRIFPSNVLLNLDAMTNEELKMLIIQFRNNAISKSNRLTSLLSFSSEERYSEFMNTYPDTQRLPQKLIASYLGMTPEHLSYIKSKFLNK